MKRIVICCDGTWNSPDKTSGGIPIHTNVVKMANAIASKDRKGKLQLTYYDPGVGTSGSWLRRIYDGATGRGLSRNILEAYSYLIRNYEVGDELFFFGFSRGAFTVRSLAGLIINSGILKPNAAHMIRHAFALYRSRSDATHPRRNEATLFRKTYALSDRTPIKFIGVWDTVGALGNPLLLGRIFGRRNQFHDTRLSSTVSSAYQAIAIDEKRRHFKPTLFHQQPHATGQVLEQVWFAGVHSNIGGGYESVALSDVALGWMCEKARRCGLRLNKVEMKKEALRLPDESRKGFYLLIPAYYRPIDRVKEGEGETFERLHPSVNALFVSKPEYHPANLLRYYLRFPERRPSR